MNKSEYEKGRGTTIQDYLDHGRRERSPLPKVDVHGRWWEYPEGYLNGLAKSRENEL